MFKIKKLTLFALLYLSIAGCHSLPARNNIYQISTIGALMQGRYEGALSCGELKKTGDFGIGTFDGLDGELIELDGKIFQVKTDGIAYPVSDNEKVPFAVNTFFHADKSFTLENIKFSDVQTQLDSFLSAKNSIYAIRINGQFSMVKTRSVPKQEKPYPPLTDAVKNQKVFELKNVRGTLVGFRFPAYFEGLNGAGYHFHFLTEDKKSGGHVLDFQADSLKIETGKNRSFFMQLPETAEFDKADLTRGAAGIAAAEQNPAPQKKES